MSEISIHDVSKFLLVYSFGPNRKTTYLRFLSARSHFPPVIPSRDKVTLRLPLVLPTDPSLSEESGSPSLMSPFLLYFWTRSFRETVSSSSKSAPVSLCFLDAILSAPPERCERVYTQTFARSAFAELSSVFLSKEWSLPVKLTRELSCGSSRDCGQNGMFRFRTARTETASVCVAPETYCEGVKEKQSCVSSTKETLPVTITSPGTLLYAIASSVGIGIGFN